MTFEEFQSIDKHSRLERPKIFNLSSSAPAADASKIENLQVHLKVQLPTDLKIFLQHFGGGEFGLINVFCADEENEWYMIRKIEETKKYIPSNFLPISDDYAGGFYGYRIGKNEQEDDIFYWNMDGGEITPEFSDLFTFIASTAYGQK